MLTKIFPDRDAQVLVTVFNGDKGVEKIIPPATNQEETGQESLILQMDALSEEFVWVNQESAAFVKNLDNSYSLSSPAATGESLRGRTKKKTPPYSITVAFSPCLYPANYSKAGLLWRDSASGKLQHFNIHFNSAVNGNFQMSLANHETPSTNPELLMTSSAAWAFFGPFLWMKISDNGTTRTAEYSPDGRIWNVFWSGPRDTYLIPDEVGFAVNPKNVSAGMTIYLWRE